jgi:hypothetical protein
MKLEVKKMTIVLNKSKRTFLQVLDGLYLYIPLSPEEKNILVPTWGEAANPAFEILIDTSKIEKEKVTTRTKKQPKKDKNEKFD